MTTQPPPDPSAARATLRVGDSSYRYYDLTALGIPDLDRLPYTVKVLIENAARHAASGSGLVTTRRPGDAGRLAPGHRSGHDRAAVPPRAGHPPGLHRRPVRGGPGRHARRDRGHGRRPGPGQPARPRRPGDRPLGPGGPVRLRRRVPDQRRARVRAQRRAVRAPPLGAGRVRQLPGRPAGDRHRPPGQPRVPGRRGHRPPRPRRHADRLPRHPGRDRLAHDHDQRPGRGGLGRGRDRGRGRAPGPAAVPAAAHRGRLPPGRRDCGRGPRPPTWS